MEEPKRTSNPSDWAGTGTAAGNDQNNENLFQGIFSSCTKCHSLESLLQSCLDEICHRMGWQVGHAYIWDDARAVLVPLDIWVLDHPETFAEFVEVTMKTEFKKPGLGLPGRVYQERKAIWIHDVMRDDNFPRNKQLTRSSIRGGVAFPVVHDDHVIAVLEFFHQEPFTPSPELALTLNFLTSLFRDVVHHFYVVQELKTTSEQLQNTNALLTSIVENIPHMIFLKNAKDLTFELFNRAGEEILGLSRTELLGKSDYDFFPEDQARYFIEADRETLRNQQLLDIPEEEITSSSSEKRILHTKKVPILDEQGNPLYLLGISHDITERKALEAQLQQVTLQLQAIFDNTYEFIGLISPEGRVLTVNKTALEVFNIQIEDVIGQQLWTCPWWAHSTELQGKIRDSVEIVRQGGFYRTENKHILPSGQEIIVDFSLSPVKDETGQVIMMVPEGRNITELKRTEDQLIQALGVAREASKAKSDFLASMSHELRTPLNGIIGMSDVLKKTDLNETQRDCVRIISSSSDALLTLISDILDFSKIEAGKLDLFPSNFDLKECVLEMADIMTVQVAKKGLALITEVAPDTPVYVTGDKGRVRQILLNLVGNAVKFTEAGEIRVSVSYLQHERLYVFTVKDTGIGIPADKQASIFDEFTQVDPSISRKFRGAGLGLTIAKRLVNQMGGDIAVSSLFGEGTTFCFKLPLQHEEPVQPVSSGKNTSEMVSGNLNLSEKRVLLVEDNLINQKVILQMLKLLGANADTAISGLKAIESISRADYDLILMDCHMPEMDGYETTRRIREMEVSKPGARVPILALTADVVQGVREHCLDVGMDDYLTKPLKLDELKEALYRWMSE